MSDVAGVVLLIMKLVAQGLGTAKEVMELAKRVRNGENITIEEAKAALKDLDVEIDEWDAEIGNSPNTEG